MLVPPKRGKLGTPLRPRKPFLNFAHNSAADRAASACALEQRTVHCKYKRATDHKERDRAQPIDHPILRARIALGVCSDGHIRVNNVDEYRYLRVPGTLTEFLQSTHRWLPDCGQLVTDRFINSGG